ncbi:hypothetical protein B9T31_15980 [Acinetobacter sp. ANC 4558]|uniref:hypothetical protein n=1 Tax=Acinetobacter sp. ANC 4558 TaxID=1977876 RepID=UPI000A33CE12|nr:hypothetical protein [Acinetobacter sp. ANC 4558]OTG80797.1 hypothetical protein B9T31_15980 [Acinetobacter sp. ANC 4558]
MQIKYYLPKFHQMFTEIFEKDSYLMSFINNNKTSQKWIIYSDYCFQPNNNKHHIAIAFTIFPHQDSFWIRSFNNLIHNTHRQDIKKSYLGDNFYNFLKCINQLPIFTFALIMDKNFNAYKIKGVSSKEYFLKRYDSLNRYYKNQLFVNFKDSRIRSSISTSQEFIYMLKNKPNVKLNTLGQIDLCTTIVSTIFKLIADNTNHKNIMLWCSDRDEILTYMSKKDKSPVAFDMIFHDFQLSAKNKNQLLSFFSNQNTDYDNLIRIPDFIAGALSDMSYTKVSNKKFIPILHECISNQKKISVYKLIRNEGFYKLNKVLFDPIQKDIVWNSIDWDKLKD